MSVPEETLRRYVEGFVPARLLSGESGAITALDALAAELRAVRVDNERLREELLWALGGWRAQDVEGDQQRYETAYALASAAPGEGA